MTDRTNDCYLGIDVGTTNAKVVLIDAKGSLAGRALEVALA